jgi:FlaA1/EpsC-like NDP-sugar epimerase
MREVCETCRPHVVFHAAAFKHVPALQTHPEEAVKTNVDGTAHVLAAARAAGVERFVNVSIDKAADPVNVLGATKRIAERLTTEAAMATGGVFLSVRFGNVLGSRGSVLEVFRAQAARAGRSPSPTPR